MVYGAIVEKGEKYYTNLEKVFDAINNKQLEYNWLITDSDCNINDPRINEMLSKEYCWINGEDITDLVTREEFQWNWAVLSAFDNSVDLNEVLIYDITKTGSTATEDGRRRACLLFALTKGADSFRRDHESHSRCNSPLLRFSLQNK